jgi:Cu/Ag efflux pump CusA
VLIGEQRYDLVMRYQPQYRDTKESIQRIRLLSPTGERVSLAQLTKVRVSDGGSEIYREANSRYDPFCSSQAPLRLLSTKFFKLQQSRSNQIAHLTFSQLMTRH